MKQRLPWRAHNPGGWAEAVAGAGLQPLEEWALLRLFDAQWAMGSIPGGPMAVLDYLAWAGLATADRKKVRAVVLLAVFFPEAVDGGRCRNPELHAERERATARQQSYHNRASQGGRAAAVKRLAGEQHAKTEATADA